MTSFRLLALAAGLAWAGAAQADGVNADGRDIEAAVEEVGRDVFVNPRIAADHGQIADL